MYRALYDFTSSEPKTLKLKKGDSFTVIEFADEHWWVAQNGRGEVGFIPRAYIEKDEVSHSEVLKSIDRAIESIHFSASDAGAYTGQQRDNLQKLIQHRRAVVENHRNVKDSKNANVQNSTESKNSNAHAPNSTESTPCSSNSSSTSSVYVAADKADAGGGKKKGKDDKRPAPAPPMRSSSTSSNGPTTPKDASIAPPTFPPPQLQPSTKTPKTQAPKAPPPAVVNNHTNGELKRAASPSNPLKSSPARLPQVPVVPPELGSVLVELVRSSSGLSFAKSQATVALVLDRLAQGVPAVRGVMHEITGQISNHKHHEGDVSTSHDAERLQVIFDELAKCKDDSQQRSWALHEDEAVILEYLNELLSILTNANPSICRQIVQREHYQALDTLLLYYQMETRWSIRMVLLQVFGALCALEAKIVTHLLYSVLPLELARDLKSDRLNIHKFCYTTLVLSMLFSSGEPLPFHHYEILNAEFVSYLLDEGEDPADPDSAEQILDSVVTTLLAFNLHFLDSSSNVLMRVLARKGTVKAFTEKIMALMNNGVDPVRMFDHYNPAPPNSVYKLLCDVFSSKATANLLYTNDAKVLVDILLRNITDLPPGKSRTEYLTLTELIITNSEYSEHQHRRAELERCFHTILREEGQESDLDQQMTSKILDTFPQYFRKPAK